MEFLGDALHWNDIVIDGKTIPSNHICRGKHIRLLVNNRMQNILLKYFFPKQSLDTNDVWLTHDGQKYPAGSPLFCSHIGSMIRRRGLLANLSILENLLLPFLYTENREALKKAEYEALEVAELLGLKELLYEQAGERSAYTHALISLGRCMLKKPDVIVMQEVHMGMPPERLQAFHDKSKTATEAMGAGVLYLTSFQHEGSGLEFSRTYEIKCDNVPDVSGIW